MRPSKTYTTFFIVNVIVFIASFFFLGDILKLIKGYDLSDLKANYYISLQAKRSIAPLLFPANMFTMVLQPSFFYGQDN